MTDRAARQAIGRLGALLLDAGTSVTDTRALLTRSLPPEVGEVDISVLPADVVVADAATSEACIVKAPQQELSLLQSARAHQLLRRVATGELSVQGAAAAGEDIRALHPHRPSLRWTVGSALVSVGLAVLFRCPWWAIVLALIVAAIVGALTAALRRIPGSVAILPFACAFIATFLVGETVRWLSLGAVPLFAVCAPIAILVPGAMITNSLLELTSVDVITGTARLIYGTIMLGFMAAGIAAASSLTHLSIDTDSASLISQTLSLAPMDAGWQQLPPAAFAWIGVIALAIGVGIAMGADAALMTITVAMMATTYGMLLALGSLIGDIAAAGVTAGVLFLCARIIERTTQIGPAVSFFQPAFLLLVPGTVGLVALMSFDQTSLLAALATFVSLCLGTKTGAILSDLNQVRRPQASLTHQPSTD